MRGHRLSLLVLLVLAIGLFSVPVAAQDSGADPEVVNGEECITYPETGPIDLQYCVRRHFEYVHKDGELVVLNEYIIYTFTIINGQPVSCVSAEQITIINGITRHERGRFTC